MAAGRTGPGRPRSGEPGSDPEGPDGPPAADAGPGDEERVPPREEIGTVTEYGMAGRWAQRRREKIRAELARNRAGGHKVPTWVLVVVLVVFVVCWVLLIVLV